jgi:hypothetical protein
MLKGDLKKVVNKGRILKVQFPYYIMEMQFILKRRFDDAGFRRSTDN